MAELGICFALTVLEGVSLVGPAVLDHEWNAIIELQSDLLGSASLEAVV